MTMDVYEFCTPELKKSLDQGREFEEKLRDEEEAKRGGSTKKDEKEKDKSEDVEMKEEGKKEEVQVKEYFDHTGKRLVGPAAKAAEKAQLERKHD